MSGQAPIINEPERVILVGNWATEVIYDVTWAETENLAEFQTDFEIVSGHFMADPSESFYQGVEFMSLIRRRSDGRLFGYQRWEPIAKHAEADEVEPNGEQFGFEPQFNDDFTEYTYGPHYVWQPVEPFTTTGYRIANLPPSDPAAPAVAVESDDERGAA